MIEIKPNKVFEEATPCTTNSHCTEASGDPSCICDDDFEFDGSANCIRIDYCDRVSEANYVCSTPDSECVTENDAGACTCISGFNAYSIVDGLYAANSEGIFLDESNIHCANPFPCSTGTDSKMLFSDTDNSENTMVFLIKNILSFFPSKVNLENQGHLYSACLNPTIVVSVLYKWLS